MTKVKRGRPAGSKNKIDTKIYNTVVSEFNKTRKPRKDAGVKRGPRMKKVSKTTEVSEKQVEVNKMYEKIETINVYGTIFKKVVDAKGIIRYV